MSRMRTQAPRSFRFRLLASPKASSFQTGARLFLAALAIPLAYLACGGDEKASTPPPQPSTPPPVASHEPEPVASATASASASAAPEPKKAGRMVVGFSDPLSVEHTFGQAPAKIEIGDKEIATLRIPEDAIHNAVNLTFRIEKQGKSTGTPVGKVYRVFSIRPPSQEPVDLVTNSDPFKFILPAGSKKDANLAIGDIGKDPKTGAEKITWKIIAPTKIDDVNNQATFEIGEIKNYLLHVTTKAPTK